MAFLEFLVSKLATVFTLGMFSSGFQTVQKIKKQGTGNIPILPFVTMATSAFVWTNYGLMKGDGTILFVNFIGCVLNCTYILLYYWYTPNKKVVYKTVGGFVGILMLVHMYSNVYHANQEQAIEFFGLFGNVLAIAMFASPLAQLRVVIETGSTESMSFLLSFMVCVQCLLWWWYGVLISDFYVMFPNIIGTVLGFIQLAVFGYFKNKQPLNVSKILQDV